VPSWSDHEAGVMVADNPGRTSLNAATTSPLPIAICCSSIVPTLDCMLMAEIEHEPFDTKLSRVGIHGQGG
jgi:hypothetical protein